MKIHLAQVKVRQAVEVLPFDSEGDRMGRWVRDAKPQVEPVVGTCLLDETLHS
jgi:hypothetical protein